MLKKAIYLLTLLLICVQIAGHAATYYNLSGSTTLQSTTSWGTSTTGTGTHPTNFTTSGDVFNLYNGSTGTISAAWVVTGVTLNVGNGSTLMTLTIPSGFSLSGTGSVNLSASGYIKLQNVTTPTLGTLNGGSTVEFNGTGAQTIPANTYGNLIISGARTGTPAITFSGTTVVATSFAMTLTGAVTYVTTGNTFVYAATTGGATIFSAIPYNNLSLSNSSGIDTANGNISVGGVLTTNAGTFDLKTFALATTGTPVTNGTIKTQNTSSTPFTAGKSWTAAMVYNAPSGGQTVVGGTYTTLTLSNTSGTQTASGALTVSGTLTTTAGGTLDMSTFLLSGTLATVANNGAIQTKSILNPPIVTGKNWGGTIEYYAATGSQFIPAGTYNNLTMSNTSGTQTANAVLTVNGTLTTTAGGTLNMGTFALAGAPTSVSNSGTINTQSVTNPAIPTGENWGGTVNYNATTGAQFIPAGTYNILTLSNTSGTETANGALTVNGTLTTTSAGTLAMGANQLSGSLTATNNGTVTTTSTANPALPTGQNWSGTTGVVTFSATTGGQFVPGGTYKTLNINNTSGTNTVTGGTMSVSTSLVTTSGGTLAMSTNQLVGAFTPTNNGTITTASTSNPAIPTGLTWTGTTGAITFAATTGGQSVPAGTFQALNFSNTSGTNTAVGALTVNTSFSTTAGGTLDLGTNLLSGAFTPTNSGTISTQNTSTTPIPTGLNWGGTINYYTAAGGQTVLAGTYNNLTLSNTSGTQTPAANITVNGTLTTVAGGTLAMGTTNLLGTPTNINNDGIFTTTSTTNPPYPSGLDWSSATGTVTFTTRNQSVPLGTYNNLTFGNTSGTNTAVGALTINGTLTTTSGGTLAMAGFAIAGTPADVNNNGTITTTCTTNPAIPTGLDWTGTTGQVTYSNTAGGQFVPTGTYKNLRFNSTSGTNTAVGSIVINGGIFRTTAGGTLDFGTTNILSSVGTTTWTNAGTIKTSVPTSVSALPIPSGKTIKGTVNYAAAAGAQTIVSETSYVTLTLSNSSGTNTAAGNITVTTLNTTAGGTLDMTAAYRIVSVTTVTNNGTIKTGVPTSVSATPIPASKTWGGTIIYTATAGAQTVVKATYNNLTLNNSSGTNTAAAALTVNGALTTTAGGIFDMSTFALSGTLSTIANNGTIKTSSTAAAPITASKNWSSAGGLVQFGRAAGGQTIVAGTYNNLKFSNTSGTVTASGILTVKGTYTNTAGGILSMSTFAMSGTPVAVNNFGTITTSSTTNPALPNGYDWSGSGTGVVTFALTTGGQSVPDGTYNVLNLNNTSGTNTARGEITIDGTLTTTAGGTFDMGSTNDLDGSGTFTNNGTIKTSEITTTSSNPIPSGLSWGGTITYAATTGAQTVMDGTYNSLTLSNTSGTNTANSDIVVNSGTMTTTAGGTLDMGNSSVLSGTGTFTNNGTILTSVPTSWSATPIPSGKTWGGTIIYGATTGQQTIVSETSYNNLTLSNTSDTDVTAANLVVNGTLNTSSGGVLDMGTNTLSGTLSSITGAGTIMTANTSATPISSGKTWPPTIAYYGATGGQTIMSGTYTGGLINSNTSGTNTVVAAGTVTIPGDLTLSPGSVMNDNGVAISLGGNINGSGTETGTGGITMTSSGNTIDGAMLGKLTLNSAGTFTVINDLTINTSLTLTSGQLDISANNLIFGTAATTSGTFSSSNMIIANGGGQVQKLYSATGSFLFPVGDNIPNYTPITLNFTGGTFGSGAYAWVYVTKAKHPNNANTTNYLNRYWSTGTSGITSPIYSVSATYVTGDVTGTEASMSMGQYPAALPWIKYGATNTATHTVTANAVTSITADFTGISTASATVTVTPTTTTICSGGSVGLSVSGGGNPTLSYTWSPSTGLSATTGTSVTASPTSTVAATFVYTVTITDGNGLTAFATSSVSVNPLPIKIAGNTSTCKGSTTTLSDATSGGTWATSNTTVATVGTSSGIVSGVNVGTSFITYKLPTGCTDTDVIIVNAVPSAITGTTTLCANATTTLSDAGGGTWSSSNTAIATAGSTSGVISGVLGGTATITFTAGTSCFVTASVLVNPILPITGNTSACIGSTTPLSDGTAGGTWSSSNTSVATVGSGTGLVSGVVIGTAIITYKISSTGCNDTNLINVNAVPSAITGTTNVCVGLTTALNDAGGGTWSSSNTSVAAIGSTTGIVTGVSNGTATITFTAGSSCIVITAVTVNPLPAAITGASPIVCVGATATLSDAGGGIWSSGVTTIATIGSSSGILTGVSGVGTSTITYTLGTGCIITTIATVNPLPSAISGATSVCAGATTTLSDAGGGTWASSTTTVATIGSATRIVTGSTAGTTTITYTLPVTGCTATMVFTVNPLPSAISGTATVCVSANTTLSDAGGGTWASSATTVATIGSGSGIVTGVLAGTSTITYTLATGCKTTVNATVFALPGAISGTTHVCPGTSSTLSDVGSGTWSSSNTTVATVGSTTRIITGVATGTATITFMLNVTGCTAIAPVTVNSLPASISGTTTFCTGATSNLSDATAGGTWSSSDVTNADIGTSSGIVTGISSGPATITYKLGTGCIATVAVSVNDLPPAIIGVSDFCQGTTTPLTDATTGGTWASDDATIAAIGSVSGIVTGYNSGAATITYTDGTTGCYTLTGITVDSVPAPISGTFYVCTGLITTLVDTTDGGTWYTSDITLATVDSVTGDVTGVASGVPVISYQLSSGCQVTAIVTVVTMPAAITGASVVCVGGSVTLSNSVTGGTWSSNDVTISTVGTSSGIVTGVSANTDTITYSMGYTCTSTAPMTVNPSPAVITGTPSVCVGLTTPLSDISAGGTWSSSSTTVATVGTTGLVTGSTAGTATISYKFATGCAATVVVTVNPNPVAVSGTATVCAGSSTGLSDATGGGTWFNSTTTIATVGSSSGLVTGVASGTSTITYSLPTGCIASKVVTVNPTPVAITGTASVCIGLTTPLTDVTAGGTWSSSSTPTATIGSSTGIVTGVAAGTSTISYKLGTGCAATLIVTVNPLPVASTGTATVCAGLTTTFSDATAGGNWTSGTTTVATIGSSSGIITGVSQGTSSITYTLATGCLSARNVTVNPLPASITGPNGICVGATGTLSDATASGTWASSTTTIATIGSASGIVTGVTSGSATITYTITATGCTTIYPVTINPLPSAISGTASVCAGLTTTLSDAGGGTWASNSTTVATVGSSSGVVTGVSSGTATITYTLIGCTATGTVTVNPLPVSITGSSSVCTGLTTTLSDGTASGTWISGTTTIATVGSSSGVVTGVSSGTSTITYKLSATGCLATNVMTVNPLPSAISGAASLCVGGTITLSDPTAGGNWSSSNTSVATIGSASGIVSPVSGGTATITYTLATGCIGTASIAVTAAPSLASATNSGPICAGVTLNLSANSPSNVTTYSWAGPVAITASTTASASVPTATTGASGTYSVTVSNGAGAGCSITYTTTATVNATPAAAPTNNSPICIGGSVTLTAHPAGGASVYTWSGTNLSSTTAQNPTATPTVTATYSLTVSDGSGHSGCSPATVYTTTVTVNSVPTAGPTNNGPICSGSTVTLTANPGGSANTYAWSGSSLSSTTAQNPTATPTVTATYSLTVSYGSGNPGCSPSTVYTTTVTVRPTGLWLGAADTSWTNNTNWCGNVPVLSTNVLIPSGLSIYPVMIAGSNPANDITIQSGASLKIKSGTLQIGGTISNSGTFNATTGSIEMVGGSAQTIPSGAFSGNTVNNLTVNNSSGVSVGGTLNVAGILKLTSGNLTSNGYVTLLSTASQTALIDGSGSGDVLDSITIQCYLDTGFGYKYISSPFAYTKVNDFSSYVNFSDTFPNFYYYDENLSSAGWVNDSVLTDTLQALQGYTGNFGNSLSSETVSLGGIVNNGTFSVTLYNHNDTFTQGFNLVGNPYPSPINWDASSGWTKTNIDNAVYYFNASDTNKYTGDYSSYINGVSSDGIADSIIPAMQGFFVHVTNGSYPVTATLGTTNSTRVNNLTPGFHKHTAASDRSLLRLVAGYSEDSKHADPVVVYFDNAASDNFNKNLDAVKLLNTDERTVNLYSVLQDKTKLSIESIPFTADSTRVIPLGLQNANDGWVTFNARTLENIPGGLHIYLYDTKTGAAQDLAYNPQYKVHLSKGKQDARFYLMFTLKSKSQLPFVNGNLNAYASGGKVFVYLLNGKADLAITNMAGQVVARQKISGTGYHEIDLDVSSGIYVVSMISDMGKQSKKIFIGNE